MNTIRLFGSGLLMAILSIGVLAGNAFAAIDLTLVTFPITELEAVGALILVALAALWVVRKVLSLVRT